MFPQALGLPEDPSLPRVEGFPYLGFQGPGDVGVAFPAGCAREVSGSVFPIPFPSRYGPLLFRPLLRSPFWLSVDSWRCNPRPISARRPPFGRHHGWRHQTRRPQTRRRCSEQRSALRCEEHHLLVGIDTHPGSTFVHHPMMLPAEEHQVPETGLPSIGPMLHMMGVREPKPTPWKPTSPVPCLQGPA